MISLQTNPPINRCVIWTDTGLSDQPLTKLMCNFKIVTTLGEPTMGDRAHQPKRSELGD